jgi:hypothetical protein
MLKRILSQDITIPAYLLDPKEKEYQDTDPIDNMLPWIRKCNEFLRAYVEFNDLSKQLSSSHSQLPIISSLLSSSSNLNNFQTDNNIMNNNGLL